MKIVLAILCGIVVLLAGGCVVLVPNNPFVLIPVGVVVLNLLMLAAMYGYSGAGTWPFTLMGIIDLLLGLGAGALAWSISGGRFQDGLSWIAVTAAFFLVKGILSLVAPDKFRDG
jgi:hypothetical protein